MYIIPFGPLQYRSQVPIYVNFLSTQSAWTDLLRWPLQLHRYLFPFICISSISTVVIYQIPYL